MMHPSADAYRSQTVSIQVGLGTDTGTPRPRRFSLHPCGVLSVPQWAEQRVVVQIGFLYLRYVGDPKELWDWYEPYFPDEQVHRSNAPSPDV